MKQILVPLYLLTPEEFGAVGQGKTVSVNGNVGTFMIGLESNSNGTRLKKNGEPRAAWGSLHRKGTRKQPDRLHCSTCKAVFPTRMMLFKHLKKKHGYVGGNQHQKGGKNGDTT